MTFKSLKSVYEERQESRIKERILIRTICEAAGVQNSYEKLIKQCSNHTGIPVDELIAEV